MVKKVDSYSQAARQEWHPYESSKSNHLMSCKNVPVILMIAIGFVLYTKFLLQDVMQLRVSFPVLVTPRYYATVDKVYYSYTEEANDRNGVNSPSLAPVSDSPIRSTDISNSNDSMNVQTQQEFEVQDDRLPNSSATPDGDDLSNTTTSTTAEPIDSPSTDQNLRVTQSDVLDGSLANSTATPSEKFSVLVGVFVMQYEMKRRDIIRLAYRVQSSEYADFTLRFIMGGYNLESWLEWENTTYGDMIVLKCKENMNEGKTFTYFSSLPDLGRKYDYVMKADDDSYVRLSNLGKALSPFPRTDLYYGMTLPCEEDNPEHMFGFRVGAGYMISWDLVVWIKESPIPRNNSIGLEDCLVGDWFKAGDVAKNQPYSMHLFHNHPDDKVCARPLSQESILIHKLKSDARWYEVIDFFNSSRSLTN